MQINTNLLLIYLYNINYLSKLSKLIKIYFLKSTYSLITILTKIYNTSLIF